jgi:uncharacterized protein DUF6671
MVILESAWPTWLMTHIVVVEHDLTVEITFAHIAAPDRGAVSAELLSRAGFPSHALVIRPNAPGADGPIIEGVADDATLADVIARCAQGSADGLAAIETDVRADRNTTRMRHIARLAKRFAARLTRRCRDCGTPGYGAVAAERGLAVRGVRSADRLGRRAR